MIQRLESQGLIERVNHEKDGRRVLLRVTKSGSRMNVPSSPDTVERAVREALRRVPKHKRTIALSVLDELVSELLPAEATSTRRSRRTRR